MGQPTRATSEPASGLELRAINGGRWCRKRQAQLRIAEELAARRWPAVEYTEIVPYPCADYKSFLAVVDLVGGDTVQAGFLRYPFPCTMMMYSQCAASTNCFGAVVGSTR